MFRERGRIDMIYVCDTCGSENIEQAHTVYIPMNEPASLDDIEGDAYYAEDRYWCPDCNISEDQQRVIKI